MLYVATAGMNRIKPAPHPTGRSFQFPILISAHPNGALFRLPLPVLHVTVSLMRLTAKFIGPATKLAILLLSVGAIASHGQAPDSLAGTTYREDIVTLGGPSKGTAFLHADGTYETVISTGKIGRIASFGGLAGAPPEKGTYTYPDGTRLRHALIYGNRTDRPFQCDNDFPRYLRRPTATCRPRSQLRCWTQMHPFSGATS